MADINKHNFLDKCLNKLNDATLLSPLNVTASGKLNIHNINNIGFQTIY